MFSSLHSSGFFLLNSEQWIHHLFWLLNMVPLLQNIGDHSAVELLGLLTILC